MKYEVGDFLAHDLPVNNALCPASNMEMADDNI